jgi:putative hemolysin
MDFRWSLLAMMVCLLAEGFFSGSEIGVVSADRIKLRHEAAKGSRGAKLALRMLERPEWLLSTTLIGTNIAVVTNTTIATALMLQLFGEEGSWFAIILVAPLIWILGEIVPKSVFQQRADSITPRAIHALYAASVIFYPILVVFTFITRVLARIVGGQGQNPFTLREEIISMLQMPAQEGDIEPDEKTMIRRMFNFSETTAQQVMVPLIDVVAIEQSATCAEAMRLAKEKSHVRLPVFNERIDRVVGVLNALELLDIDGNGSILPHIRQVQYVPGSISIRDLLLDLRKDGDVVAVVVDEFGGAEGIVTIEDIMEEVVEDMEDEYDSREQPPHWIRKVGERDYVVSARIELGSLQETLGIELPESKYTTLAGLLLDLAYEVPAAGTVIEAEGITFTVRRSTPQAIHEVHVRW